MSQVDPLDDVRHPLKDVRQLFVGLVPRDVMRRCLVERAREMMTEYNDPQMLADMAAFMRGAVRRFGRLFGMSSEERESALEQIVARPTDFVAAVNDEMVDRQSWLFVSYWLILLSVVGPKAAAIQPIRLSQETLLPNVDDVVDPTLRRLLAYNYVADTMVQHDGLDRPRIDEVQRAFAASVRAAFAGKFTRVDLGGGLQIDVADGKLSLVAAPDAA